MKAFCRSYCPHGGVCVLDVNHEGAHSSGYCSWRDEEALTKTKADELFLKKNKDAPLAEIIVGWT